MLGEKLSLKEGKMVKRLNFKMAGHQWKIHCYLPLVRYEVGQKGGQGIREIGGGMIRNDQVAEEINEETEIQ